MILVGLEIENYKQFAGRHQIAPTPQGIVGVVGANGVGKTTLFEAIEWCLYNPSTIRNEDVPPRNGVGATCVRVTLEDPSDGLRYVVERRLKGKAASAEIYRADQPEQRIVQGSRQVSDYVARRLVGLSHRAFVSTFFTRQKELSFFGALKETERRREVARLLGLETIRKAQEAIGEDRATAQADARGLRFQYMELTQGRDFAAESEAAAAEVAAAHQAVGTAEAEVAAAGQRFVAAGAELERWRDLEREDSNLALELERVSGDEREAVTRRDGALAELDRLGRAARTRDHLLPIAQEEPARREAVAAHEREQERHRTLERLLADLRRADAGITEAVESIADAVRRVPAGDGIPAEWRWSAAEAADPLPAVDGVIRIAAGLDIDRVCDLAQSLGECRQRVRARDEAEQKAERFRVYLARLEAELETLVRDGDPAEQVTAATEAKERAAAAAEHTRARVQQVAGERARLEKIVAALRAADFSDGCPTCFRPFTRDDAGTTILALSEQIARQRETERDLLDEQHRAETEARQHEQARSEAAAQATAVATLRGRIADGHTKVEEAEREAAERAGECAEALARAGLTTEPSDEEVTRIQEQARRLQVVANALPLLRQLRSSLAGHIADRAAAETAIAELGEVAYDAAAHEAADRALAEARDAIARVNEIERQIARRGEVETTLTTAETDLGRLSEERAELEMKRAQIGFDPAGLERAAANERAAREAERAALRARETAIKALAAAEHRQTSLTTEHERIAGVAARADARGRDADELDRMYREFTRFDQYVAERVTPQLAEQTGELLAAVTEGKYDRVAFDENYGLEIFDGDEKFPVASFSGGERDVAALCARLALSRLVGGQAGHPPEFLVLDEVFGSLDRDRRAHVLEMLGTLAANTDAFRQLFIISHVDDVRASSIFNQVWRLSESEEGVSHYEDITDGGVVEEL